jgi:uncharacterized membrane protein YbhN (UPF0104 family)
MLLLPLAYAAACFFSKRREWQWRGHRFALPGGRMALAQLGLSMLNHLSAAVIAVPTHVPGGLGVLEAVYIGMLGGQVAPSRLLAGLLTFRALYYLVPLACAALLHVLLEVIARRRPRTRVPHAQ